MNGVLMDGVLMDEVLMDEVLMDGVLRDGVLMNGVLVDEVLRDGMLMDEVLVNGVLVIDSSTDFASHRDNVAQLTDFTVVILCHPNPHFPKHEGSDSEVNHLIYLLHKVSRG